eukprot:1920-Heterococcus_DN1.PRE.1
MAQATALSLDLLAVPLVGGEAKTAVGPYVTAVLDALESLKHRAVLQELWLNFVHCCVHEIIQPGIAARLSVSHCRPQAHCCAFTVTVTLQWHYCCSLNVTSFQSTTHAYTTRTHKFSCCTTIGPALLANVHYHRFPIFGVPYPELMARLWAEPDCGGVSIKVSAVREDLQQQHAKAVSDSSNSSGVEGSDSVDVDPQELNEPVLRVGAVFDAAFVQQLEARNSSRSGATIDLMGEQGEFHTHVTFL